MRTTTGTGGHAGGSRKAVLPGRRLAVSVGQAVIGPDTDEDLPAALQRADAAMYERRVQRFQVAV